MPRPYTPPEIQGMPPDDGLGSRHTFVPFQFSVRVAGAPGDVIAPYRVKRSIIGILFRRCQWHLPADRGIAFIHPRRQCVPSLEAHWLTHLYQGNSVTTDPR